MALYNLYTKFLLFLLILIRRRVSSSGRSRPRDPRESWHKPDLELINSLDDKTYEDLMNEHPLLRQMFQGSRNNNSWTFNSSALPHVYAMPYTDWPYEHTRGYFTDSNSFPSDDSLPGYDNPYLSNNRRNMLRRTRWLTSKRMALATSIPDRQPSNWSVMSECYWCGLNETLVPTNSLCHDIFDSPIPAVLDMARYFRARCIYWQVWNVESQTISSRWYPPDVKYESDRGLKLIVFGKYWKGCFKRFVDVGSLYTARGCRSMWGARKVYTKSAASHRQTRLEFIARGHKDVCIHSPEASLTPFSRAISLYVRYHVCVCSTNYCNAACSPCAAPLALALALALAVTHSLLLLIN